MDTLRRALAPLTFVTLMVLLFASVAVGALFGPTLLLLTPLYVYLGGGVARFAFAELARGRVTLTAPVVAPSVTHAAVAARAPATRGVSPVVA